MCEEESRESFSEVLKTTMNVYRRKIARSILRSPVMLYLLRCRIRRTNVETIMIILGAELNSFKKIPKAKQIHTAIKILKATNNW